MTRRLDEKAAWRALRDSLIEEDGVHPAEEILLAYADKRSSLASGVVDSVEAHLAGCPSCRDEVGVLGSMTMSPNRVMTATEGRARGSIWQRIIAASRGPAWRPALAVAVLVALMVPTLRMIGRDRSLLRQEMVQSRDARDDEASPVHKPESAASAELRLHERGLRAARKDDSPAVGALSRNAMEEQRGISRQLEPPTLEFLPGGRVWIHPGDYDRLLLRIRFVRATQAPAHDRRADASAAKTTDAVAVAPTVSVVELRVTSADGRENRRRIDLGSEQNTSAVSMVDIPVDWLAPGDNRVDIVDAGGSKVADGSYVISR